MFRHIKTCRGVMKFVTAKYELRCVFSFNNLCLMRSQLRQTSQPKGFNVKTLTKKHLLMTTLIAGMATSFTAVPSFAQDAAVEEDEIVVTGSRIKRDSNLDSSIPVATLGEADLENTSAFDASEVIRDLPQAGVPGLTTTTTNFSVFSAGLQSVDLRNLGDSRTLTLMDGRRLVPGVPGSSIVDFSMIPPDFIERVEVVTGGASSVYGSEAIAGVVNIILKDDFEGVEASLRMGETENKGGFNTQFGLTMGSQFDNDKGNVLMNFTVASNEGIKATDTEFQTDNFAFAGFDVVVQPLFSTFPPQGRYSVSGSGDLTIAPDGSVVPWTRDQGFNRQENRRLLTPQNRYSAAIKGEYQINPLVNMSASLLYAHVESDSDIEPFPLSFEDVYNPNGTVPGTGVPITNPLIPQGIRDVMIANGDDTLAFVRRMSEVSDREGRFDRTTMDFALGFDGAFPFLDNLTGEGFMNNMSYEVYMNYGRATTVRNGAGQINVQNLRFALDAIEDPLNPGNIICRDATARAFGCVPADIFGFGTISPEAAQYIAAPGQRNAETEQFVLSGIVTGDLFEVPAGPVGIAFGAEYREIESADIVDALTSAGLNAGNRIDPTVGEFDVYEVFGEILVPIVKDMGIVDAVNFEGAYRTAEYSTAGTNNSWKAGLTASLWDEQLRLRGVAARAARAPDIGDLFSGNSQSFTSTTDPCEGVGPADVGSTDPLVQSCLALPGVQAAIAGGNPFTYTDLDIQSQYVFFSGSPLLKPEVSDSYTVGFVFQPTFHPWLEGFSGSLDYVNFEIEDAITNLGTAQSARLCLENGNNPTDPFCQNIVRDATTSRILFGFAVPRNAAVFATDAVDLQLSYRNELPYLDGVDFDTRLLWSRTLGYSFQSEPGAAANDQVGTFGIPEDRLNWQLNFYKGPFSINWRTSYMSEQLIDEDSGCDASTVAFVNSFFGNPPDSFCYTPGSPDWLEHGITARYEIEALDMSVYGGVDNLTDEFVYIPGGFTGNVTGTETNGGVFDALGRRYFIGLKKRW